VFSLQLIAYSVRKCSRVQLSMSATQTKLLF